MIYWLLTIAAMVVTFGMVWWLMGNRRRKINRTYAEELIDAVRQGVIRVKIKTDCIGFGGQVWDDVTDKIREKQ